MQTNTASSARPLPAGGPGHDWNRWQHANELIAAQQQSWQAVNKIAAGHAERLLNAWTEQARGFQQWVGALWGVGADEDRPRDVAGWSRAFQAYAVDSAQRQILLLDALRHRGNTYIEHERIGMPPVLQFGYDMIVDGRELERPVNYMLLKIRPPEGVVIDENKRPIMIIDPRAGHGAGIGGFKSESQVGEAFEDGHPVYFVAFRPMPEPGQTLADVCDAEVAFLEEISRRHPKSGKPAVIGNCQGGWATMLLAARAPELAGPLVINGAPMSYWAGKTGQNPMRYTGGLVGGAVPALFMSDLGDGLFDGSLLVQNFENLNPANSLFAKYYNLYANVDTEAARFLDFERWWSGFFLMNGEEIHWIVENLFVGNRLARGDASLGGEPLDLRRIASPIVVFASEGDNITPPQQALNWIADLYSDVDEIKAVGQRIVYMVHKSIGHLGIFVAGSVAGREHDAITDTMRAIEALAPGLYEMKLDDSEDRIHIRFEPRTFDDLHQLDDGRDDEHLFAAVARLSEFGTEVYEMTVRPWIRGMVTPEIAESTRRMQPVRLQREVLSDHNPWMPVIGQWAEQVRGARDAAGADNPFIRAERAAARLVEGHLDLFRDARDAYCEVLFHSIYGAPALRALGGSVLREAEQRRHKDLRKLPAVKAALQSMTVGGAAEGIARMLCLLAKARGYVRRSRLERQIHAFSQARQFAAYDEEALSGLVHQQSLVADFEPEQALATLPLLLDTPQERQDALAIVMEIAGPAETMHPNALALYRRFEEILGAAGSGQGAVFAQDTHAVVAVGDPDDDQADDDAGDEAHQDDDEHDGDEEAEVDDFLGEPVKVGAPDLSAGSEGPADDLERIDGIGPRMAEKLTRLGVRRFAQLAALGPAEAEWLDLELDARGRVAREAWVEQAQALDRERQLAAQEH